MGARRPRTDDDRVRRDDGDRDDYSSSRKRGDADRYPPPRDSRDPPRENASRLKPNLNEYFIEGQGISREVLQIDICKYLGPEATCKPGIYHDKQGFLIRALRPFTPEMLEDLKIASREYRNEAHDARTRGYREPLYEDSQAHRNARNAQQSTMDYYPPSVPSSYPAASLYPGSTSAGYPPSIAYSTGPQYASTYAMQPGPGSMPAPGYSMQVDPGYNRAYIHGPPNPGYPAEGYQYPPGPEYDIQPRRDQPTNYAYPPGRGAPYDDRGLMYYDAPQPGGSGSYQPGPPRTPASQYDQPPRQSSYDPRQGPSRDQYTSHGGRR